MEALQSISWPLSARSYALLATILLLCYIAAKIYGLYTAAVPYPGIPLISLPGRTPKDSWIKNGNDTIRFGIATCTEDQTFQIMSGTGPKLIIRQHLAEEVARNKHLSFGENFRIDYMAHYPGFDGIHVGLNRGLLIRDTVIKKLTQSLALVTGDIVEEASACISDAFGENPEWESVELDAKVQLVIARLSSRVFLGKPLCRDSRWLQIAEAYTINVFIGSAYLRAMPGVLRPLLHWFVPACRTLRKQVRDARILIGDDVKRREAAAQAFLSEGKKVPKKADTIGWFVEMAQEHGTELSTNDLVSLQLFLTIVANHTTSEAINLALKHLCEHSEYVQPLRDEIIEIIGERGWSKASLSQLSLMDSFLKESQRHSRGLATLNRIATSDTALSNGLFIRKGTRMALLNGCMDPKFYDSPTSFDAYRFVPSRQAQAAARGQSKPWQFVSLSPEQMGFGLGLHACPGRFFVAQEMKIALAFLLLRYDWSFDPAYGTPEMIEIEGNPLWNPKARMMCRRRMEEIDLNVISG
ncbi:Cytochrome-P450 [Teratosphaeria destructans]|uniref:Cytochrome-P450 n=1 Tax=Teratosphaeria destructans TaxID=418781 RepID=A0A9W7SVA2_9PEZI|nr:Cytochrome-P450 [Teratosphaeria destructans]